MKLLKKETYETFEEFTIVINDLEAAEILGAILDAIEYNEKLGYKHIAKEQETLRKEFAQETLHKEFAKIIR